MCDMSWIYKEPQIIQKIVRESFLTSLLSFFKHNNDFMTDSGGEDSVAALTYSLLVFKFAAQWNIFSELK